MQKATIKKIIQKDIFCESDSNDETNSSHLSIVVVKLTSTKMHIYYF